MQSWELLTPAEQQALRRLGIFRGSFTREAAAAVCGELKIENEELKNAAARPHSQFSILNSQFEALSARELEVLRLMAVGNDNAQIARALVVAVSTVKSHVNHIFGKLGARNRVEAVRRAQDLDLL